MARRTAAPRRQRGLSLIELMISMAIGLFLLAGLVGVFVNSSQSSAELSKSAQQIENGRFAIQSIVDDLAHAGYYGYYTAPTAPGSLQDPCAVTAAAIKDALGNAVQAYNKPSAPPSPLDACLPAANHLPNSDILVVRRVDSNETTGSNFEVGRLYLQANANPDDAGNPLLASASAADGPLSTFTLKKKDNSAAVARKMHVHIYFLSPCSLPLTCTGGAGDDAIPTLKRLELTASGFQVVPIAEGIEDLQFDYGVDADADGAPETPFIESPAATADWANVVAVQVSLLARNVESTPGYTDTKTYNLGAFKAVTPRGAYKRHAYTGLVRIVNVSARRETP